MKSSPSISQKEINDQLDRILSFPVFSNSMILSGFLTFIVEETLEGRENLLKEYTIGTNVLAKKVGYDPQLDASVRIHAGRLRRALNEYYSGPGYNDPIIISVPKGAYIPNFELITPSIVQSPIQTLKVIFKPTLAVIPFHCLGENDLQNLADGLCDQICTEFTNFNEITVVSYYSSRKIASQGIDSKEAGQLLDATYLITGSIQSNKNLIRVRVQLIKSATDHQVWASSYERERSAMGTFTIQDDIVKHVINQIGGSHGIIFREAAKASPIKHALDVKVYDAVFWYYYLLNDLNEETFKKGLVVMQNTVQFDPQYALGWAILGETYVAGFFFGYDCSVLAPLEEGVKCGKKALSIDPRCQHAYQTLGLAYLFQHRPKDCLLIIDQWLNLKSKSTGIAGGLGFCLICAGEYERGYSLLSESIQVNPYYPWWFNAGLSIYHFQRNEYEDAVYWAEKMQRQSIVWELILKAVSYVEMENFSAVKICTQELVQIIPDFWAISKQILGSFLQSEEMINRLFKTLKKADL
ncbi:tetratricopeptide repeat protein [Shivajiella indica]|uniref:TolB amino-terminal domain-containing protein n=1 Tax=Shivajiella indica TaxID=872115 RepID=A0ABW5B7K4_9BACT